MQVQLDKETQEQLEAIARDQGRDVAELAEDVIKNYVNYQRDREQFREKVRGHMRDHAWLLTELSKR